MIQSTIQNINTSFIAEAKNSPALLADMAAMEKYMSESYSGRIIVELLQNADDAHSSRVYITEKDGNVIFANNGRPFNDADVMAISRSGASEKKRGETIGYRGIGFKSTSFLSSEIIIYSNETAFSFSKAKTAEALGVDEENVPTIRIPFLVDAAPYINVIEELLDNGFTTIFIFKSSNKEVLQEEIGLLSADLMLFLRNLKEIETSNMGEDKQLRVVRKTKDWGQEITIDKNKWGMVDDCLAFKMEDDEFVRCEADEAVYYTFLPTYDKAPFLFKMNGDFSTDPSRKHLRQDDTTQKTLEALAKTIANVIEKAFREPRPVYRNLLQLITDGTSFSTANMQLKKYLKKILSEKKMLRFNDGTTGRLSDYKCFPIGFESSVANIVRKESETIRNQSLAPEVYENLNGVEEFMATYSDSVFSSQDIADVLQDKTMVANLSEYTYSYLLGKTVQAYNRSKLMSTNDLNVSDILIKKKDGAVIPIRQSNMSSKDISKLLQENDSNQSLTNVGLKAFTQELGLEYKEDDGFKSFLNSSKVVGIEEGKEPKVPVFSPKAVFKASKPIIPRWRSAENACVEIEKFLGNEARDVSTQNLGYDVESTTPTGEKRYIEVKSVSKSDGSFSLTNNEYTAAHQYGDAYYICLLHHGDDKSKAIYIQNPLGKLKLEKRIRQWEWFCEEYQGEEIEIEY
ncbi:MAG: DUF3883 domain-containing protein [Prevotella sp.]|nr:DUF3883 domain-containing protein [Prevotella sp.]